jgi:hypothetical protein
MNYYYRDNQGLEVDSLPKSELSQLRQAIQCLVEVLQKQKLPVPVENQHYKRVNIQVRVPSEG